MKVWRLFITLCLLTLAALPAAAKPPLGLDRVRPIPVQENGRLKPFDTLALETVRSVTGKGSFQGEDPTLTYLRWMADPEAAGKEQNIECRNLALKRQLNLAAEQRWFSYEELRENPKVQELEDRMHEKMRSGAGLDPDEKEFSLLLARVQLLLGAATGQGCRLVPNPTELHGNWMSVAELRTMKGADARADEALGGLEALLGAVREQQPLGPAADKLRGALAAMGPVPPEAEMEREVGYNHLHPFRYAWMLYLGGFLLLLIAPSGRSPLYWAGLATSACGLGLHVYGFILRCLIAGRPPVTNMYESVIWVAFGAVFFAMIFELVYRARFYLMSASVGAIAALILADSLPAVLDPSIKPLTPVLRSNFWLTIHVLTITLSYAAFLLALGLGHMVVWQYAFRDPGERLSTLNKALYKAIQVGVLLLAAGTILGGVWANYSWGRFWGWDPKEVWALIALLGYLALLHGRYAGWLRQYGLAAGSIVAFMGVLMAWYGVNFVLGVGLHSYGFGTGGGPWVAVYVTVELAFVALATRRYRSLSNRNRTDWRTVGKHEE